MDPRDTAMSRPSATRRTSLITRLTEEPSSTLAAGIMPITLFWISIGWTSIQIAMTSRAGMATVMALL